jgi:hypothetical protein
MIVMKFGGTSVQDAQVIDRLAAIVRERLSERPARTSALANSLTPDDDPAPEARKSLAPGPPTRAIFAWRGGGHPEASNEKSEGWVSQEMHLSPVGAAQGSPTAFRIATLLPSSTMPQKTRQLSGHDFSRAVQPKKRRHPDLPSMRTRFHQCSSRGEGPCVSSYSSRLPKQKVPRVCSQADEIACSLTTLGMTIRFLRASVSPWWGLSR